MFTHIHLIRCQRTDEMATRGRDSEEGSSDDDCERDIKFSEFIYT